MTEPIALAHQTIRFGLPFLYPGQAQKEYHLNETAVRLDFLLHPLVSGQTSAPPVAPTNGDAWLVGPDAEGEWAGHEASIAGWQGGYWHFIAPCDGMSVYDASLGQRLYFLDGWTAAAAPTEAQGGTVVDAELRLAFTNLLQALRATGMFV